MNLQERLIDPKSPDRRPRRAAYALPTLFTAGNVFLGFYAILEAFQGAMGILTNIAGAQLHFQVAAISIGAAVILDGLDGRIARMTNTVSDFGREMDSLADVITFGLAPAVLAFTWGVQFIEMPDNPEGLERLRQGGYFFVFLFLLCGAMRLARFNIQKNPMPKNPGRPDRKYFVGLPIPSAAATVASIVYAAGSNPLRAWPVAVAWLALMFLLAFLMVSTWRYPSFKDLNLTKPRSPLTFVMIASLIYLVWMFPQPVLLGLSVVYVASGILLRAGGIMRRWIRPRNAGHPNPEHQVG
jgi:CDP-diacylglycerol---serine O-phosphatidyltransferase